jgi:methyltransferase (TIGR00027 family)
MKDNQVSSTALLIAKGFVVMGGNPDFEKLIPLRATDISYILLKTAIGIKAVFFKGLGKTQWTRFIVRWVESLSVPGILLHFIIRKRKLEDLVETTQGALGQLEQLVIIGAGADTLGLRLNAKPEYSKLKIFEIDHPATQMVKRRAIDLGEIHPSSSFHLLAADLSRVGLLDTLNKSSEFDFNKVTLFIAEGLMMYLPLEAVASLLDILNYFPQGKSRILFTYMLVDAQGRPSFVNQARSVTTWLKRKNEPFIWGKSPAEMRAFIEALNLKAGPSFSEEDLRKSYLEPLGLMHYQSSAGENITWAER